MNHRLPDFLDWLVNQTVEARQKFGLHPPVPCLYGKIGQCSGDRCECCPGVARHYCTRPRACRNVVADRRSHE